MKDNSSIRSIGVLSYKVNSPKYIGKRTGYGNLIKIANKLAIVTAAHCVYEIGIDKFNIDMTFSTIYGDLKDCLPIETAIIHKNWCIDHKIESDTAILIPKKGSYDFNRYHEIASPIKIFSHFNDDTRLSLAFIKGIVKKRVECIHLSGNRGLLYGNRMISVEFKGRRGLSGCPWFCYEEKEWKQVALTSCKLKSQKKMLWGPLWENEFLEALNSVQGKGLDVQNLMIQRITEGRRNNK